MTFVAIGALRANSMTLRLLKQVRVVLWNILEK